MLYLFLKYKLLISSESCYQTGSAILLFLRNYIVIYFILDYQCCKDDFKAIIQIIGV